MENVVSDAGFWRGRRILLTGHTGFKGTWAWLWLERMGAVVHGLSIEPTTEPALWSLLGRPGGAESIVDIRDRDAVARRFEAVRPEIVIHMAAQALVHRSYVAPFETYETNLMGLVNVLDAARASETVTVFVNVTSDKCYDNREQLWAYREDEPMGGSDPYSASKGCAELITASYRRSFFNRPQGPWLASGRAGNVIGGGDWSDDRLVPDCMKAFSKNETVLVRNPLATRPWQHVLEPINGYLVLARCLAERGTEVAEGWNFGPSDSETWSVGRVVDFLAAEWGPGASWMTDERAQPKEAMLLRVDATKARFRLGWKPVLSTNEALSWSIEWYKRFFKGADARQLMLAQIEQFETLL